MHIKWQQLFLNLLKFIGMFLIYEIGTIPLQLAYMLPNNVVFILIAFGMYLITMGFMLVLFIQIYRTQLSQHNPAHFGRQKLTNRLAVFMGVMVVLWLIFLALQIWISQHNLVPESANQKTVLAFVQAVPWWMGLDAVVFAPIIEELLFRGLFFNWFFNSADKRRQYLGVFISGAVFAAVHDMSNFWSWLIYAVMGWLLALTYAHTKDIRYNIGLHMFNNLISLI
ncbi:CPBP family intramembrane glutamic endopeptidase [Pediococcus siamensis]|uniref:CPBP family intramembrane glutamic endopeptidase n=1 Tax=Pediococcus siamensis TaxID=381829 RepID=UPI0039A2B4D7